MSGLARFRKIERVPILRNQVLKVEFGKSLGIASNFEKRINLTGSGTKLISAILEVTASQTYLSGAEISLTMNQRILMPSMMWHALENGVKSIFYDVTTSMVDGVNSFSGLYRTAFGVLSDQLANISTTLVLELETQGSDVDPVEVGGTKEPGATTNVIAQKLKDASNLIIAGVIIGVIAISGIYLVSKNPGDIRKFVGR
jgi:hypothetical protein